jgi:CAAX protease family protein
MLSKESANLFAEHSGASTSGPRLAPRWHTFALIALMVTVATVGLLLERRGAAVTAPAASGRVAGVYLPMLLVQGGLLFYVCRVGRSRSALRDLLGPRWAVPDRLAADLACAAAVGLLIEASELASGRSGAVRSAAILAILPRTGPERLVWGVVAVTVGSCEEVVYRGYLQIQLGAFTGRAWVAIALQASLFGIAHGDQGLATAVRFALYGVALGALARWRRSLLPGMVCHVAIDLVGGWLAG